MQVSVDWIGSVTLRGAPWPAAAPRGLTEMDSQLLDDTREGIYHQFMWHAL
jgi:hypothetical protein